MREISETLEGMGEEYDQEYQSLKEEYGYIRLSQEAIQL